MIIKIIFHVAYVLIITGMITFAFAIKNYKQNKMKKFTRLVMLTYFIEVIALMLAAIGGV